jgi:hypothetical protein
MYVCCVCCVLSGIGVSATSWSLVQRSPTDCGVSQCDGEASLMRRPWPTRPGVLKFFGGGRGPL